MPLPAWMARLPYRRWRSLGLILYAYLYAGVHAHWRSKVVALILALTAWFYLHTAVIEESTFKAPLQILELPASWNVSLSASVAQISLEGPNTLLVSVTSPILQGHLPFASLPLRPQEHLQTITMPTTQFFRFPEGIRVVGTPVPPTITITVLACETKILGIRPVMRFEAASGYELGEISSTPSFILAKIPKIVAQDGVTYTEPIELGKIAKAGKCDIPTQLVTKIQGWPVEYLAIHHEIIVHFTVRETISVWSSFRLRAISYLENGTPPLRVATPTPLQVQITGPKELVEGYSEVIGYVILPENIENVQILPLRFMLPEKVKVVEAAPIPLPAYVKIEQKN